MSIDNVIEVCRSACKAAESTTDRAHYASVSEDGVLSVDRTDDPLGEESAFYVKRRGDHQMFIYPCHHWLMGLKPGPFLWSFCAPYRVPQEINDYLKWLCNDSPWMRTGLISLVDCETPDKVLKHGLIIKDPGDVSSVFLHNFLIASRFPFQYSSQFKAWIKMIGRGHTPEEAFILCIFLRGSDPMSIRSNFNGDFALDGMSVSRGYFNNFVNASPVFWHDGKRRHIKPKMWKYGYDSTRGINSVWGKRNTTEDRMLSASDFAIKAPPVISANAAIETAENYLEYILRG